MTFSVCPFLRLAAVCGGALLCSSCLPMLGTGQMLAGSHLADGLLSTSPLDLVWRGDIRSFPSSGLDTPRGFKVSPADSYSLLMERAPALPESGPATMTGTVTTGPLWPGRRRRKRGFTPCAAAWP